MHLSSSRRRSGLVGGVALLAVFGALGATLAFGLVTRQKTQTIPPFTNERVTAKCPSGKSVLLGGFQNTIPSGSFGPETLLMGLRRTPSGRGWKETADNSTSGEAKATSIAYCGRGRHLSVRTKTTDVLPATSPANESKSVTAKCPRGKRVALGGIFAQFDATPPFSGPEIWVSAMRRTTQRGWKVAGSNQGGSTGKLTAIAYCGKAPRTSERAKTVTIPSEHTRGHVTAKCPKGHKVAFGGFKAEVTFDDAFVLIDGLARTTGRKWRAEAVNSHTGTSRPGDLTALAYCV